MVKFLLTFLSNLFHVSAADTFFFSLEAKGIFNMSNCTESVFFFFLTKHLTFTFMILSHDEKN